MQQNKHNKLLQKKILVILAYIVFVSFDIMYAVESYYGFSNTYGDKAFSKGISGLLICNGGHILYFLLASILLFAYLKKGKL